MIALRLVREPSANGATLGSLYVNDRWVCWTLEDVIRQQVGIPVAEWKVHGKTAIPAGRYPVVIEWSPKFSRDLLELKDVPGFSEVKFHAGNSPEDTDGCPLVGLVRGEGRVLQSRAALDTLHLFVKRDMGPIFIDVENPPARHITGG